MLKPLPHPDSPYKKQLQEIARIANYQPVASIPQPTCDFNYSIASKQADIKKTGTVSIMELQKLSRMNLRTKAIV